MNTLLPRQTGFDDLRVFIIFLVVLVHSNVTYSGIGSWYYVENPIDSLDVVSTVVFGVLGAFLQSWFMGTLFFLAGVFSAASRERRGASGFVKDRAVRLLVPFFGYLLVVDPIMLAAYSPPWLHWSWESVLSGSGPLWFTGALFAVSASWALIPQRKTPWLPTNLGRNPWAWGVAALVIGATAWAIRLVYPIGSSWFNFQVCFFASYGVLFAAGAWLGSRDRFQSLPASWARLRWITPLVSLPAVLLILVGSGAAEGDRQFTGGPNLPALLYALWEAVTAVAMTLGLAIHAREKSRRDPGKAVPVWRQIVRENGFAVYFVHAPVLWGLSLALSSWQLYPLIKAPLVAFLAFAASLGVGVLVRRVPGLRKVLS